MIGPAARQPQAREAAADPAGRFPQLSHELRNSAEAARPVRYTLKRNSTVLQTTVICAVAAGVLDRLGHLGAHPVSRRPVSNLRATCRAQASWADCSSWYDWE
jgi:hypothetical protein